MTASTAVARGPAHPPRKGLTARPWWPWARRALTFAFFALVTWLIVNNAREIEWSKVIDSMRKLPASALWLAAGLALASHALYSTFDLFGRAATQHGLPVPRVMAVTFISYAFNLNLGSLVGGVAFRYRLYSRLGLDGGVITRVLTISMFTNWLGYVLLAGAVFALWPPELPADWPIDQLALRAGGTVALLLPAAYLIACAFAKRRDWSVRGHELSLPSLRFAGLQLLVSCINWSLIAGAVYVLLQQRVDYPAVLAVLLLAAVAGVITHVPAGLGVLEAVFIAFLSPPVPQGELLGALLAYRAIYYLVPLALAGLLYLTLEARAGRKGG